MLLKPRVMDPKVRDDISEALAYNEEVRDDNGMVVAVNRIVPVYAYHYYPPGLRERTLGPHSKDLVGVTRFYPKLAVNQPPTVIDFEPMPPEKFWEEQKRQFLTEKGIAYVAIYLGDRLSEESFKERVRIAMEVATTGHQIVMENAALRGVGGTEVWLQNPELDHHLNRHAAQLVAEDQERTGKLYRGVSRTHMLRKYKAQIVDQLRKDMKDGRCVDPLERYLKPAAAAQ